MYDGNPGETDFGSSQREVRVSEGLSYRESTVLLRSLFAGLPKLRVEAFTDKQIQTVSIIASKIDSSQYISVEGKSTAAEVERVITENKYIYKR